MGPTWRNGTALKLRSPITHECIRTFVPLGDFSTPTCTDPKCMTHVAPELMAESLVLKSGVTRRHAISPGGAPAEILDAAIRRR